MRPSKEGGRSGRFFLDLKKEAAILKEGHIARNVQGTGLAASGKTRTSNAQFQRTEFYQQSHELRRGLELQRGTQPSQHLDFSR